MIGQFRSPRPVLAHVLCVGMAFFLAFFSTHILAQNAPPEETDEEQSLELEKIAVTGSRIKRIDAEGALPVTVIDREMIDLSGESSLADYVRSLSFNTHGSYRSQMDGNFQGSAQISLRGLGSERTLVLVDGRRLPKSPISTSFQDLNTIPMGSVERIEVLSDGASAIYGSDAIGGVVNIITRDDYEGWELMLGLARTDAGGGDRDYGSAMYGAAGENWNLVATYSWNDRDITLNRHFDWYEPAEMDPFGNNFTTTDPASGFPFFNFTAIPGGCDGSEAFSLVPWFDSLSGEACIYDTNFEAGDETSVGTQGVLVKFEYDISPLWTAWLNASASETDSYGQRAPREDFSLDKGPLPPDSPNNPTNPASAMWDPAFGENVPVHYWHRFDSLGPYNTDVETTLEDLQLGMTGWVGGVELDFGIRFTQNETHDITRNILDNDQAYAFIVDGSYDLQHPHENPDDVLKAIRQSHQWWWDYDQNELFATAAFDWLHIGGRPVSWVLGAEYREEISDRDSTHQDFGADHQEREVLAVYFETLLALTNDLELSLAGRYDDYSDWGDNFAPKVSLRWQALDQLVLRASYGEGFRAPELSLAGRSPFYYFWYTTEDPQSCEAMGQPPGCEVWFSGTDTVSSALDAEQSDQFSVGLVWQPVDVFSLIADYYEIEIDNKIQWMWPDLVLIREQLGEPNPPNFGVDRYPNGVLFAITHGVGNFGYVENSGVDLTLDLGLLVGPGLWNSHFLGSYLLEDTYDGWDALAYGSVPESRGTLSNSYEISDFTFAWNLHYIGSYDKYVGENVEKMPSWTTHDFQASWRAPWNGTVAIGAQNAFNEQPRLFEGQYNTWLYDAFGRIVYARYTQLF